jgi:exodeoxyribonuclease VII large subunit
LTDGRRVVEQPTLSVSEATTLIQAHFDAIERVAVTGEIQGKLHSSGHWYGSLRDGKSSLDLIVWRGSLARGVTPPESGTQVVAYGRFNAYNSKYSLVLDKIEVAGVGALLAKLEELKQKFIAEGLFDTARKKPVPRLPRRIGIVTSPTGAVIRDMLHRIADRCPRHVVLWPVAVQGAPAAAEIAAAVQGFNALPEAQRPDVLIIARGGGSLEDLMPFNDERVVRTVAASAIPVISGVGHEPDVTLCDFAASLRAPTPSAAAELAVPVRSDLLAELNGYAAWLLRDTRNRLQFSWEKLSGLQRLLPAPQKQLRAAHEQLTMFQQRLMPLGPTLLRFANERLAAMSRILLANNPEAPLTRGYAHVSNIYGHTVKHAAEAVGELNLRFADGTRRVVAQSLALAILFVTSAWAAPQIKPVVKPVRSSLQQGGFFIGEVAPDTKVYFHNKEVDVNPDGRFFVGFDRFEPVDATLKACQGKNCVTLPLTLTQRTYQVQNIVGVPPKTVNPGPAELKQAKIDTAHIIAARSKASTLTAFEHPLAEPITVHYVNTGVYGSRRLYGGEERSWHKGHDFAVPRGTPIHAPADGIVTMAAMTFFNGNLVIIDHGDRLFTIYAHLSAMDVKPGDKVRRGQLIGKVGTTGRSTGPHLHWGVYWQNMAIDPILLVNQHESTIP